MQKLCASCNVCDFLPEQKLPRTLSIEEEGPWPRVLVIDDNGSKSRYAEAIEIAHQILGDVPFTYTTTIRCDHSRELELPKQRIASARCSVWTNSLVENRSIILATPRGLDQMKLGTDREPGDMFRNHRAGLLLCIKPLLSISAIAPYRTKAQRLLKEAKLL